METSDLRGLQEFSNRLDGTGKSPVAPTIPPGYQLNPQVFKNVLGRPGWKACMPERTYNGTQDQQDNGLWIKRMSPERVSFDVCPGAHEMVLGILDDPSRPLMPNCETRVITRHSGYVWYAVDQAWFDARYILEP